MFNISMIVLAVAATLGLPEEGTREFIPDPYTMLPYPMQEQEIENFARILVLSEAQELVATSLFQEYVDAMGTIAPRIEELNHRELRRRTVGTIRRGEMIRHEPQLSIHDRYEEVKRIFDIARPLETEMIRFEDEYFNNLSVVLAEPQRERLYEARQARLRIRYQVRTEALPGAQVDLVSLVHGLGNDILDNEALGDLLAAYEERLVQLLQIRHDAQKRVHLGDLRWLSTYDGVRIDATALSERGRVRANQMRLESSLRRLNMATLEALSIVLDETETTNLLDAFYQVAHSNWGLGPRVDQTRTALEVAIGLDELEDDVWSEIAYLQESFIANHRRLLRRLSDAEFNFRERMDRTLSAHVDDMAAHDAEVESIQSEIRALCERTMKLVNELVDQFSTTEDSPNADR